MGWALPSQIPRGLGLWPELADGQLGAVLTTWATCLVYCCIAGFFGHPLGRKRKPLVLHSEQ